MNTPEQLAASLEVHYTHCLINEENGRCDCDADKDIANAIRLGQIEVMENHIENLNTMKKNQVDEDNSDSWDHGHFCAVNDIFKMAVEKTDSIKKAIP